MNKISKPLINLARKIAAATPVVQSVSIAFHYVYYTADHSWHDNTFLGYPILQHPIDLQIYQEILFKTKPTHVVQTGIADGGSLLFFASILDLLGAPVDSKVFGIDIRISGKARSLNHPRIRMIEGNSVSDSVLVKLRSMIGERTSLVSLDSDHRKDHVLSELAVYRQFVAPGSYLVAEDTNINGHPVNISFGPGPKEAVKEFLKKEPSFIRDDSVWRRHMLSHHAGGWLRRV
jgi:cephalosporin hydroxylase